MCNQKKSQTKQYKKKLLNEQQKQVIFYFYQTITHIIPTHSYIYIFKKVMFELGSITIIFNPRNFEIGRSHETIR